MAYLAGLSDEALPSLARLPADMSVYEYEEGNTVGRLLEERRVHAARMAGSWRTWNLGVMEAARVVEKSGAVFVNCTAFQNLSVWQLCAEENVWEATIWDKS